MGVTNHLLIGMILQATGFQAGQLILISKCLPEKNLCRRFPLPKLPIFFKNTLWEIRLGKHDVFMASLRSRVTCKIPRSTQRSVQGISFFSPKTNLVDTLPETNKSPLKMDGWKTILSFWDFAYFQGLYTTYILPSGELYATDPTF